MKDNPETQNKVKGTTPATDTPTPNIPRLPYVNKRLVLLLGRLRARGSKIKKHPGGYSANCPGPKHDPGNNKELSLTIIGKVNCRGAVPIGCKAACDPSDILAALDLKLSDCRHR